jgi:hypothetical protein
MIRNWLKYLRESEALLKMISDLKEYSNKQANEVMKSIQDLDKKVSKAMKIMKNKQVEMLKIKTSIN